MDTENPSTEALSIIAAMDPATIPKTYDIPPHLERIVRLAADAYKLLNPLAKYHPSNQRATSLRQCINNLTPADLAILDSQLQEDM